MLLCVWSSVLGWWCVVCGLWALFVVQWCLCFGVVFEVVSLGLVLWSGGVFLAVVCLRKGSPQTEEGPMGQDRVSDHGRPVGAK